MTRTRTPDELFAAVQAHVAPWSPARLQHHGLDLLFGEPHQRHRARMAKARIMLAAATRLR